MSEREEIIKKIVQLEKEKEKMEKEMQNPFLNINLRTKYKKELPLLIKDVEKLKKQLLLSDI